MSSPAAGLPALEQRLAQDLAWLELPAKPWVVPLSHQDMPVLDIAIIGAGMAGLAAATALKLLGIKATLFDQANAGQEGPWVTTARMQTLRSPKQLTGPALGLPALTFRAWFEAQFGLDAWNQLDKIPRVQWMEYLRWYRQVMPLDIRNQHRVTDIDLSNDNFVSLSVTNPAKTQVLRARRVILATGRDGLGSAWVPDMAKSLPRTAWAHSSDDYDYTQLAGKRVGVIGAGASAMDCAATALEAGAQGVDLLIRRADLPRINKGKGAGNAGIVNGYYELPNEWKWRFRRYINQQQVPPPHGSTLRVSAFRNARFHFSSPITELNFSNKTVFAKTPKQNFEFDFLIFATGFRVNFSARPEFRALADRVQLWRDHFSPQSGDEDAELADYPVLGSAFEFQAKHSNANSIESSPASAVSRVHCFCYPAVASHGQISGDIPAISDGAQRLARGIATLFFKENISDHYRIMQEFSEPELLGDEWKPE